MIHAREDYNRFQDPENKIGEDEPVMLFRAKDMHFISVLKFYEMELDISNNREVADSVRKHIELSLKWRDVNGCKQPDL